MAGKRMLLANQDWAVGSLAREGTSSFPMVMVTEMPVSEKVRRMSGLALNILTRSMVVWVLRKVATLEGGGRLLATVL
ncbi:hypothetical protein FH972_000308 [Carpinus fangiana]|uniref:Uncharacterized protein n=1 Tax=Carpinus fangiana TaxID=176857 RepID=A0A5N6QAU0_9ROSI|nr:hypothetical protein FH972_000308 [Carpinus fangiana]